MACLITKRSSVENVEIIGECAGLVGANVALVRAYVGRTDEVGSICLASVGFRDHWAGVYSQYP